MQRSAFDSFQCQEDGVGEMLATRDEWAERAGGRFCCGVGVARVGGANAYHGTTGVFGAWISD